MVLLAGWAVLILINSNHADFTVMISIIKSVHYKAVSKYSIGIQNNHLGKFSECILHFAQSVQCDYSQPWMWAKFLGSVSLC